MTRQVLTDGALHAQPDPPKHRRTQQLVGDDPADDPTDPRADAQDYLETELHPRLSPIDLDYSGASHPSRVVLAALALLLAVTGCKRVPTPTMDRATCRQEIIDAFLPQETAVVALRPADGSTLFRTEVLEALDRVCVAFEDEQTDYELATKCLTSVPLMESKKSGPPQQIMIRDELPAPHETSDHRLETAVRDLEFGTGDVLNEAGQVAYIHLPLASFEGVDLAALFAAATKAEPLLEAAIDLGRPEDRLAYGEIAADGPSARSVVGLYDAGDDGALKDLAHLEALQGFQVRAEGLRTVAESFTVVDDIKTVRKGLKGGRDDAYALPRARPETAQILLALSMSPAARYGPRIDGRERVALIRVNMTAVTDEQYARSVRRLEVFLAQETADGATAFLCTDRMPEQAD